MGLTGYRVSNTEYLDHKNRPPNGGLVTSGIFIREDVLGPPGGKNRVQSIGSGVGSENSKHQTPNSKQSLYCFFEIPCSYAPCADGSLLNTTIFLDPDSLQVWKVASFGFIVSMADVVPHHGAFST